MVNEIIKLIEDLLDSGYTVKVSGPDGKERIYRPEDINENLPFDSECDGDCGKCDDPCDYYDEDEDEFFWGIPQIKDIIFNPPATVVLWEDGTKTVVKCSENDKFDRYAGFSAAVMKKLFGSTMYAADIMESYDRSSKKAPAFYGKAADSVCENIKGIADTLKKYPDLHKHFVDSIRKAVED